MARLPTPGGDTGNWGTVLNDYLAQAHKADGSLEKTALGYQDLTKFGGVDAADPSGREAYVSALITSLQEHRRNSVTLRELLGWNYSPNSDASVALNGFIAALAPVGIAISDPDGIEVLLAAPVRIVTGTVLNLSPTTVFKKSFSNTPLFTTSLTIKANQIRISGGVFKMVSGTETGDVFSLYGDGIVLRDMLIEGFRGRAVLFAGDGIRMHNIRAISAPGTAGGNGGFRMLGGTHFIGSALHCECGDDVFQFVPATGSSSALYNQDITDSYFIGCTGKSYTARVAIAAVGGPQNENAMTCIIRRCGFIGVTGEGGNRCFVVENSEGTGTIEDQISEISFTDCSFSGEYETTETNQSGYVFSSFARGVGRVTLQRMTIHKSQRAYGVTIAAEDSTTEMTGCDISGETGAVQVTNGNIMIRGGRYRAEDNGGGLTPNHVITSSSPGLLLIDAATVENVASSKGAVRANTSGSFIDVRSLYVKKASGATGVIGISHAPGSTVSIQGAVTGADTIQSGSGTVTGTPRVGGGTDLTIATGAVTLTAPDHRIDTESAAVSDDLDTVVFPDWALQGQIFTLRAVNSVRTIVIKDGTGNIKAAGDFSLDNTEDIFIGVKLGTNLVEISRSDNGA